MNRLAKEGLLGSLVKIDLSRCEHYLIRKSTRKSFDKAIRAKFLLKLIYFNIYGLMSIKARHGALYFFIFIDNFTRYGQVYLTFINLKH